MPVILLRALLAWVIDRFATRTTIVAVRVRESSVSLALAAISDDLSTLGLMNASMSLMSA